MILVVEFFYPGSLISTLLPALRTQMLAWLDKWVGQVISARETVGERAKERSETKSKSERESAAQSKSVKESQRGRGVPPPPRKVTRGKDPR